MNEKKDEKDDLTTTDGRKVISFSTSGESYTIESREQAAKGRSAEIQAEIDEMKLMSLRRGIRCYKMR